LDRAGEWEKERFFKRVKRFGLYSGGKMGEKKNWMAVSNRSWRKMGNKIGKKQKKGVGVFFFGLRVKRHSKKD